MLNPLSLEPKHADKVRNMGRLPSLNEQEAVLLQDNLYRMKQWAWQWRVMLLVERLVLGFKLRGKAHRAPWFNSHVSFILNSPLHWLLSGSTMLVTLRGRKSGRTISTPVNYVNARGGNLYVISKRERSWWRNLYGGAYVTVRVRGKARQGFGSVSIEPQSVVTELAKMLTRAPKYAKRLHIGWTAEGELDPDDLRRCAERHVVVRIHID